MSTARTPAHGTHRGATGRIAATLTAVLTAAVLVPASPADADVSEVRTRDTTRLLDGITHTRLEVRLNDGSLARGNLLRFRPDAAGLEMRPVSAGNTVAGLEQMSTLARRELPRGALAGINGGYWLNRPAGAPNGLHVESGRLWAGKSVNRSGNAVNSEDQEIARGIVGIDAAGALIMDRLGVTLTVDVPDIPSRPPLELDEINRQVRTSTDGTRSVDGELLLFDENYGTSFSVPGGSTLLEIDDVSLGTSGRVGATVHNVRQPTNDTSFRVPEGRAVLLAYGDRAPEIADVTVGMQVGVTVEIAPHHTAAEAWADIAGAVAGGPLLIRDGQRQSVQAWRSEAFSESHLTGRQPRTAIAHDTDGRIMLLTVDGRQQGWSVGMTLRELSATLLDLGARDAVNLDGGGSTAMTVDGRFRNRPSQTTRSIANALFVYAEPPPPARGLDLACPSGTPRAGFTDTVGTIHESSIDCLAWWGVTTGVTADTYAPTARVTRAQMATFLAQWIDDVADRGAGQALPSDVPHRFTDVSAENPHGDNIHRLAEAGILTGRDPSTFSPSAPVSRAQTATLIRGAVEFASGTDVADARDTFVDDAGNVHEPAIDALAHLGVITGVGGFSYAPGDDVTRGSMAALVMRASDHLVEEGVVTPPS